MAQFNALFSSSLACWLSCPLMSVGQVIQGTVIPVPSSGGIGPTRSAIPFSAFYLQDVPPTRFQQVYAASSFVSAIPQGGWISSLRFVSDPVVPRQWGTYLPRVEIVITVTRMNPDELSAIFAENLGSKVVTVHTLGPLSLSDDATIGFEKPFFYSPADGNLLLEIKNFQLNINPEIRQASPAPLDAYDILGDPISRVYARGDANATNGIADTLGLTTYFVVVPVPKLVVSLQSTNLVIRWPLGLVEFTLQRSPILGSGASWQPAGGIVTTNRTTSGTDEIAIVLPVDRQSSARFFRLISQP